MVFFVLIKQYRILTLMLIRCNIKVILRKFPILEGVIKMSKQARNFIWNYETRFKEYL